MKKAIAAVRNALGIRRRRRLLSRGPKPAPGSKLINGNLRMGVLEEMSPQLWAWLLNLGWRKAIYKHDRRKYYEIPMEWVVELNRAQAEQWEQMLISGTAAARGHGPLPHVKLRAKGWHAPDLDDPSDPDRVFERVRD
jgi:hypothetical protein